MSQTIRKSISYDPSTIIWYHHSGRSSDFRIILLPRLPICCLFFWENRQIVAKCRVCPRLQRRARLRFTRSSLFNLKASSKIFCKYLSYSCPLLPFRRGLVKEFSWPILCLCLPDWPVTRRVTTKSYYPHQNDILKMEMIVFLPLISFYQVYSRVHQGVYFSYDLNLKWLWMKLSCFLSRLPPARESSAY